MCAIDVGLIDLDFYGGSGFGHGYSHGHADHFGGAALLQAQYGAEVVMSNTEWHYLQNTQAAGEPHPFVVGQSGFQAWLDVIKGCAKDWLVQKSNCL